MPIGPGLIIGRVGATLFYTVMDLAGHIPIEKKVSSVIVEPEALMTTLRQHWLTFWKKNEAPFLVKFQPPVVTCRRIPLWQGA